MLGEVWLDLGLGLCYGSRGGEGSPSAPPLLGEISNHPFLALSAPENLFGGCISFFALSAPSIHGVHGGGLGGPPPEEGNRRVEVGRE